MTPDKLPGFNIALEVVTSTPGILVPPSFSRCTRVCAGATRDRHSQSMGASKMTIVDVKHKEMVMMALAGVTLGIAESAAAHDSHVSTAL